MGIDEPELKKWGGARANTIYPLLDKGAVQGLQRFWISRNCSVHTCPGTLSSGLPSMPSVLRINISIFTAELCFDNAALPKGGPCCELKIIDEPCPP